MFVGEIGVNRRDFLYEITFWEACRILRGYRKRNRIEQQLLRLNAYMSNFAFRENKERKSPHEWLPLPWELEEKEDTPPISESDINELQSDMASFKFGDDG